MPENTTVAQMLCNAGRHECTSDHPCRLNILIGLNLRLKQDGQAFWKARDKDGRHTEASTDAGTQSDVMSESDEASMSGTSYCESDDGEPIKQRRRGRGRGQ